jgi:hypothetical protein
MGFWLPCDPSFRVVYGKVDFDPSMPGAHSLQRSAPLFLRFGARTKLWGCIYACGKAIEKPALAAEVPDPGRLKMKDAAS